MKKQDGRFNERFGRNLLINGDMKIDQRGKAGVGATGDYIWDRWKKTAGGMTQIVEAGSYEPSTKYTLSGTGVTTQQITSPASGHWTLPNLPTTAREVQLEVGEVPTPFDHRPAGLELSLCQRYYQIHPYINIPTYLSIDTLRKLNVPRTVNMRVAPQETGTMVAAGTLTFGGTVSTIAMGVTNIDAGSGANVSDYTADAEL